MKTWTLPVAGAQKFVANEYVAACYQVYCGGPNNNAFANSMLYADSNSNGVYDEGDAAIVTPPYEGARFAGCGGYHRVVGEGVPTNNGFVKHGEEYIPVFYWFGEVMDAYVEGEMDDFHFSDLTREDAVVFNENPNHS